jgi:hypothetical protein
MVLYSKASAMKTKKIKLSLEQVMEAHRVVEH